MKIPEKGFCVFLFASIILIMFEEVPKQNPPKKRHKAYWVHDRVKSDQVVGGYYILPSCTCSKCGFRSGSEKERCPRCRTVMEKEHRYSEEENS